MVLNTMNERIRLGIVVDNEYLPAWKSALLKKNLDDQVAQIVGIASVKQESKKQKGFRLWEKHMAFDKKYFKPTPCAFEREDIKPVISRFPKVEFDSLLQKKNLDFIIWLSKESIPLDTEIDILRFVHGISGDVSEDYLGYTEFIKKQEVLTSALVLHQVKSKAAKVIYRTWSMMGTTSMSRSRNEHMWKLVSLIPRALQECYGVGKLNYTKKINDKESFEGSKDLTNLARPSVLTALLNFYRHGFRFAIKVSRKLRFKEQWILMLKMQNGIAKDFHNFKKILPPKDVFWADPFLVEKENKNFLFFEELPFATDKGHLSVVEIDEQGDISPAVTILKKPYHLSYPFIFKKDDRYFMIPESYEAKNIQLYECTSFPNQWEHRMDLMKEVMAFDTTLYFYNNKWWMFTVISEQKGSSHNDELFLFYAEDIFTSEWTSHPQNPIISDVRCARPAGQIFEEDGKLMRPSQDCSRKYGYGFHLNEIEVLTETEYRERSTLHVRPEWEKILTRTHSFNHVPGVTVIDASIQRSRFF